jgi:hypothetical protein
MIVYNYKYMNENYCYMDVYTTTYVYTSMDDIVYRTHIVLKYESYIGLSDVRKIRRTRM